MNQENRLAEAFKMRNLLHEFDRNKRVGGEVGATVAQWRKDVTRNAARQPPVAIVGFREWIFSGKVRTGRAG
jgi:1,3-beta-glucan synthase component